MVARAGAIIPSNGAMLLGMLLFVLPSVRKHRTRVVAVQTHSRTGALLLGMLDHHSLSLPSVRKHQTRVLTVVLVQSHSRSGPLLLGMLVFADLESFLSVHHTKMVLPGVLIIPLIHHVLLLGMLDLHPCVSWAGLGWAGLARVSHVLTCE